MLRYVYADGLARHTRLASQMFQDRADQFKTRLGWDVTVTSEGYERDEYDALNPLYVIWEDGDGRHAGSMRFLPTMGRTMINDHFAHILGGKPLTSPKIWECTRFCIRRGADRRVAAALMLGGAQLMRHYDVARFAGVFDARMVRIYSRLGAVPQVLGSTGEGRDSISVGLWEFTETDYAKLLAGSGVTQAMCDLWLRRSLDATEPPFAQTA